MRRERAETGEAVGAAGPGGPPRDDRGEWPGGDLVKLHRWKRSKRLQLEDAPV